MSKKKGILRDQIAKIISWGGTGAERRAVAERQADVCQPGGVL